MGCENSRGKINRRRSTFRLIAQWEEERMNMFCVYKYLLLTLTTKILSFIKKRPNN